MSSIGGLGSGGGLQSLLAMNQAGRAQRGSSLQPPPLPDFQSLGISDEVQQSVVDAVQEALNDYSGTGAPEEVFQVVQSTVDATLKENGVNVEAFNAQIGQPPAAASGLPKPPGLEALGVTAEIDQKVQDAVHQAMKNYSGSGDPKEVRQLVQEAIDSTLKENGIDVEAIKKKQDVLSPSNSYGYNVVSAKDDNLSSLLSLLGGGSRVDQYA